MEIIAGGPCPYCRFLQGKRGTEKSHALLVQRALGLEISRLCVSIALKGFTIHTGMQLRSR